MKKLLVLTRMVLLSGLLIAPANAVQNSDAGIQQNEASQVQKNGQLKKNKQGGKKNSKLSRHNQAMSDVQDMKSVRQKSMTGGTSQK